MTIIALNCGCVYNSFKKSYVKYCPQHLNGVIADNIQKQRQLNEDIAAHQALEKQQKRENFRFKPLFEKDKRYFKKLF